jgi:hypothetical protein
LRKLGSEIIEDPATLDEAEVKYPPIEQDRDGNAASTHEGDFPAPFSPVDETPRYRSQAEYYADQWNVGKPAENERQRSRLFGAAFRR